MQYQQTPEDLQKINSHNFHHLTEAQVKRLVVNGSTYQSLVHMDNRRAKAEVDQARQQQRATADHSQGNTYSQKTIQGIYDKGLMTESGARKLNAYIDMKEHHERNNSGLRTAEQMKANIEAMKQAKAKRNT